MTTLRRATLADLDPVLNTLVRAFAADPLIRFMLPDDEAYETWQGAAYFHLVALPWFEHGEVWVTDDAVALSVWGAPNPQRKSAALRSELISIFARFDREMQERMNAVGNALRALKPAEPHWYLQFLATHPDWQRRGLGSQLSSVVNERCDQDGIAQYLETATDEDIAYYSSRGYRVRDTLTITAPESPDTDWPTTVTVTTMIRPPQP